MAQESPKKRLISIGVLKYLKHIIENYTNNNNNINKMVSPHKQIIKDDDVKECISIEFVENQKVSLFTFTIM